MDYRKWVINWFVKNADCREEDIIRLPDESYFEQGFIDSFKFILLIAAIGNEFGIQFDNDRFQDRSFSTINGLAKAIEEECQ